MADIERIARRDRWLVAGSAALVVGGAVALRAARPEVAAVTAVAAALTVWLSSLAALVAIREYFDPTLRSEPEAARVLGIEVLATVPWIRNANDRRRRRLRRMAWGTGIVAAAGTAAVLRLLW